MGRQVQQYPTKTIPPRTMPMMTMTMIITRRRRRNRNRSGGALFQTMGVSLCRLFLFRRARGGRPMQRGERSRSRGARRTRMGVDLCFGLLLVPPSELYVPTTANPRGTKQKPTNFSGIHLHPTRIRHARRRRRRRTTTTTTTTPITITTTK